MRTRFGRQMRAVLAGLLLFGGLTTASLAATTALTVGTASASPATLFSSSTAGTTTVVVPAGVTTIDITAVGGTGGSAHGYGAVESGGEGAVVTSNLVAVTPGTILTVTVAQNGGSTPAAPAGAGGSGAGSGGNGGGANAYEANDGAGGGGASAVYVGTNALMVAGGGGGAGGLSGASGGAAGQAAPSEPICNGGGGAGTQTGGGAGGACSFGEIYLGSPGGSGSGHNGGAGGGATYALYGRQVGGGGGGGGLFGGGGSEADGGGGGSSYPAADVTGLDATATPSVTISTSDFYIATASLPPAAPGTPYGPVTLQVANEGTSTSPYATTLKWKKVTLPKGLKLSSAGVLSGTPTAKLAAPTSVTVQATETVTTLNGTKKVKTKTTVQATIPMNSV